MLKKCIPVPWDGMVDIETQQYNLRESFRARICQRLRNPGIDSKESVPPAYVAWQKDSIPGLLKRFQNRAMRTMKISEEDRDLANIWFGKQIYKYAKLLMTFLWQSTSYLCWAQDWKEAIETAC